MLKYEVTVNVTRCLLGIAHCMGSFPSSELYGVGVVVGQGGVSVFSVPVSIVWPFYH